MKILHVTHHQGCKIAIDFMAKQLGHIIETQFASWNYNLSAQLASEIWEKHKDYYNSFDAVITSDTASLSRIFLQNNYQNKLIIWVCNRFDYADQATNTCSFPDAAFIELFKNAASRANTHIRSYTKFEHEYALKKYGFMWSNEVIRPCIEINKNEVENSPIPNEINRSETFFITRYHNDNIFMDLKDKCNELGIINYRGEYSGPLDLIGFKGIIHIPYAWSNLALFENWSIGNVYYIPSKQFLLELVTQSNFFWSPPFSKEHIESSEWYLPEHQQLFIYFDSFIHLKELTQDQNLLQQTSDKCITFSKFHLKKTLKQWKELLCLHNLPKKRDRLSEGGA